jgi:hypothetical protein
MRNRFQAGTAGRRVLFAIISEVLKHPRGAPRPLS